MATVASEFIENQLQESARFLVNKVQEETKSPFNPPIVGVVCGSGLGGLVNCFDSSIRSIRIPYKDIPHFPLSTVAGHDGSLAFGSIEGKSAVLMVGRMHCYEGHSPATTAYPIRVLKLLGIKTLIVTNASGGLNPSFQVGDFMIISDHVSMGGFGGVNPLIGPNLSSMGPRFPPISSAYTYSLRLLAAKIALSLPSVAPLIREGVYVYVPGPSFESRAEARFLRDQAGADCVGMSTVPEVITAAHCGLQVLGLSLITNKVSVGHGRSALEAARQALSNSNTTFHAADQKSATNEGVKDDELALASHAEVLETSTLRALTFTDFVQKIIKEIP